MTVNGITTQIRQKCAVSWDLFFMAYNSKDYVNIHFVCYFLKIYISPTFLIVKIDTDVTLHYL